jgi:hypothetical protein
VLKLVKVIFSLNPLSYHSNPWGIEVRSKGERRGSSWVLGCFLDEGIWAVNRSGHGWKRGESYLYSKRNPTVQIWAGTSGSTLKHCSQRSPLGLLTKGAGTSSSFMGQNLQQLPELLATLRARTFRNFASRNFQLLPELPATLRARTSSNSQNFRQAKVCKVQLCVHEVI